MKVVVLGGGPGGSAAALEAARLGAEVVLVEKDRLGGVCLNRGCIPTKSILRSARLASDVRSAAEYGVAAGMAGIDIDRVRARAGAVVDELGRQLGAAVRRAGVRVVHGEGRLVGGLVVEIGEPAFAERLAADAIVLAAGSAPARIRALDHALPNVWTSDDAVSLTRIPSSVIIVGGGAIGLEFACVYAAFGSAVTVIELTERVLPGGDRRAASVVVAALERMGVRFIVGAAVTGVRSVASGARLRVDISGGEPQEAEVVLSAAGRAPSADGLGLDRAGVQVTAGAVWVDEHLRTSAPGVYAVGDLIGGMMLAHVAEEEGIVAARNAVAELTSAKGAPRLERVRYEAIPACVYTFPEVASIGWDRERAAKNGIDVVQAVAKLTANGKALAEGEPAGFVQLVAEKTSGRIVGAQVVGVHAVEVVHEIAVALRHGVGVRGLAEVVHAHPAVSEAVRIAASDAASACGL